MTDRITAVAAARRILEADAAGIATVEVLVTDGPHAGSRLLLFDDGTVAGGLGDATLDARARELAAELIATGGTRLESVGESRLFVTAHLPAEALVIVGAGHIAVPLAALGVRLGFRVTVLDDRAEFATAERFEGATVVRADFENDPFAGVRIDGWTYVALVTRGHRWDFDCLRRLLASDVRPRYIGMIGSRRRVRAALHALLEAGVPRAEMADIRAPIGLEIGAETPEEIAVSIAAELVAVRRGADTETMTGRERVLDRLLPEKGIEDG